MNINRFNTKPSISVCRLHEQQQENSAQKPTINTQQISYMNLKNLMLHSRN